MAAAQALRLDSFSPMTRLGRFAASVVSVEPSRSARITWSIRSTAVAACTYALRRRFASTVSALVRSHGSSTAAAASMVSSTTMPAVRDCRSRTARSTDGFALTGHVSSRADLERFTAAPASAASIPGPTHRIAMVAAMPARAVRFATRGSAVVPIQAPRSVTGPAASTLHRIHPTAAGAELAAPQVRSASTAPVSVQNQERHSAKVSAVSTPALITRIALAAESLARAIRSASIAPVGVRIQG
jgi:hypothetical protein